MNMHPLADLIAQRARLIELDTPFADHVLMVERFRGQEAVSEPFRFEVDCAATSAHLPYQDFVGEELTLRLLLADGSRRRWHGYVTQAEQRGADGGFARYRLHLEPWTAYLALRRNCRVFNDLDVGGICHRLLAEYPQADWRFDVTQALRRRSLCIQYRETDFDFIRRLLAEEGLSFRFEHAQAPADAADAAAAVRARHRLVVFDRDAELPDGGQPSARFHRADAPEADDTIQRLAESHRVHSNAVTLASWDYAQLHAPAAQLGTPAGAADLPALEFYDGAAAYRYEDAAAAELHAGLVLGAFESAARRLEGEGRVRQLAEGTALTIEQHDNHPRGANRFVVLRVCHEGANNAAAAGGAERTALAGGIYRNRFTVQPEALPVLPQRRPKPRAAQQSALVIGHAAGVPSTERDHRVKVRFHWQREQPPGADGSVTWVRVAEWLAGPNWGSHFLPRVGTEVLIDFVGGDIDRPVLSGQAHGGVDAPPYPGGQRSAANHPGVLSGWYSRNHRDGANYWLVDDAPGQLRSVLGSSRFDSLLGLGHLTAYAGAIAWRGNWRGSGFELRSDGWVALRAGEGLLLSATRRPAAVSTQLDVAEAVGQLRAAAELSERLSGAAAAQGALPLGGNDALDAFADDLDPARRGAFRQPVGGQPARKARPGTRDAGEPTERFARPFAVTEVPGDSAIDTPASAAVYAADGLHARVQADLHLASGHTCAAVAGGGASWFAHAGGVKVVSAAGALTVQAHSARLQAMARQSVTVTSSADEIHILASQRIRLAAGHSELVLEGGNITFRCPGQFSVKGAGHAFAPRAAEPAALAALPDARLKLFDEGFVIRNQDTGEPMAHMRYTLHRADGSMESGVTDADGRTHVVMAPDTEPLKIEIAP